MAWRTRILGHIESDLRLRLWQVAEDTAVRVFAGNLRDLLLAAPAGARPTMGLDPGYRTGVKVAVVTRTGQVAATATIYPHEPQRRWDESIAFLATHQPYPLHVHLPRRHLVCFVLEPEGRKSIPLLLERAIRRRLGRHF